MPSEKRERQRQGRQARRQATLQAQRQWQRRRRLRLILFLGVIAAAVAALSTRGGDDTTEVGTEDTTTTTTAPDQLEVGTAPCPPAERAPERMATFDGPPQRCIDPAVDYSAVVRTTKGDFTIDLLEGQAPNTVNNFIFLARYRFYDGVPFHRIIPDFVVQGGSPDGTGQGGPGYRFADELPAPEAYGEGSVAMANSGPDTNGSQFFVVTSPAGAQTLLGAVGGEPRYSLFGQVVEGMDVVKALEAAGSPQGTPTEPVGIVEVLIVEG